MVPKSKLRSTLELSLLTLALLVAFDGKLYNREEMVYSANLGQNEVQ